MNINSCQSTHSVRQACGSWHIFWDITSFMHDHFSLSRLTMFLSHVVLGLYRGLGSVTLYVTTSWSIEGGSLLRACSNHLNFHSLMMSSIGVMWNSSLLSAFRIVSLLVTTFISRRTSMSAAWIRLTNIFVVTQHSCP